MLASKLGKELPKKFIKALALEDLREQVSRWLPLSGEVENGDLFKIYVNTFAIACVVLIANLARLTSFTTAFPTAFLGAFAALSS
jgi:hypothetical protein